MVSYICPVCGVEHDTVPAALACAQSHNAAPGSISSIAAPPAGVDDGEGELPSEVITPPAEQTVPEPKAAELLGRAARHMHDRAATYDTPDGERSMGKAVVAFNAITGHRLNESEGWLLLQVLKDVRLFTRHKYHADSAEDCIAYAALKAEARSKEL